MSERQAVDLAAFARRCDERMATALLVPPPAIGAGFHWTAWDRWYWENCIIPRSKS